MRFAPDRRLSSARALLVLGMLAAGGCSDKAPRADDPSAARALAATPADAGSPELALQVASAEQSAIARLPAGGGHDLVVGNCLVCHSAAMLEQQHKDTTAWNKTVTTMVSWGAPLKPADQPVLVAYLAEHFPARADAPPPPMQPRTAP